jgi:hypothetical protein
MTWSRGGAAGRASLRRPSGALGIDVASGVPLALSPWLFGFADRLFWPRLIVGLREIGAGLTTRTAPEDTAGVTRGGRAV